ncbi:MAG TPA: histidinol-phosphate transaminase [Thermomicrobiales bacterium]|nr:histidinol-phosphate transaminase [Thermomicrobiales bacterium]
MSVPPVQRRLVRDAVERLQAYHPVEAPEALAARLGMPVDAVLKLDSNENPYGCSFRVQEALAIFDRYHYYPDAQARATRERLGSYAGVSPERILIGAGSDELIDLLLLATIDSGDEVVIPVPTFGVYQARAELFGGRAVLVPRDESFDLDIDALLASIGPRTRIVFVTSPNNPTGNLASRHDIVRLLQTGVLVVVDEAYYEFCGKTIVPFTGEFDNLVVLRTFSKWAGLAGLRVGYGVFPQHLIEHMWKVKPPFNVNAAALLAVGASLDDMEYLHSTLNRLRGERARLTRLLRRVEYLTPFPSQANFILCKVERGDAHDIHERLADRGIMVRGYNDLLLRDYLRVTVGRPEDTDRLLAALQTIAAHV